ncbi:MAG: hypothetical protein Fur0039_25770 [Rhodocyclaceae bacterium]
MFAPDVLREARPHSVILRPLTGNRTDGPGEERGNRATRAFAAPLWAAPFRPFYLLGSAYGVLLMAAWLALQAGAPAPPAARLALHVRHGHELVFGFSAAIIAGILLTALPSWAGMKEVRGATLAFLALLWLAGRIAVWASAWLPAWLTALADCSLLLALAVLLTLRLAAVKERLYLAALPPVFGLLAANVLFHLAAGLGVPEGASFALLGGVYAIVLLYVLKGGFLTPVFTGNRLRARGRGDVAFSMPLEWAAAVSALAFVFTGLYEAPAAWAGAAAFAAALVHGLRLARWQGWKVLDDPLLWPMHLGYAFLVLAFALRGAADLGLVPSRAWLHAFTVGSLGPMMIALMVRVSLRHTGRALEVPRAGRVALALLVLAALLRLASALGLPGSLPLAAAAAAWAAAFLSYLWRFAAMLVRPSLPRRI